jgi:hypothetical protein
VAVNVLLEKFTRAFARELVGDLVASTAPEAFFISKVAPIIRSMPSGMYRTVVRALMPELAQEVKSANRAISWLQKYIGQAYRRTDFLADWREVFGKEAKAEAWKYTRKDFLVSEEAHILRGFGMPTEYAYIYKYEFINEEGKVETRNVGVYTNERLPARVLEEKAETEFEGYKEEWGVKQVLSKSFSKAYKRIV